MQVQLRASILHLGSTFLSVMLFGAVSGCSFSNNASEGAATGALIGAGGGAIAGSSTGQVGNGAAGGAVAGAVIGGMTGGVIDASDKEKENRKKRDELLDFQKREFDRQHREIEDLRRQQLHDEEFRRKYPDPAEQ